MTRLKKVDSSAAGTSRVLLQEEEQRAYVELGNTYRLQAYV